MNVITLSDGGRYIAVRNKIEVIEIGLLVEFRIQSHQPIQCHGADRAAGAVLEQYLGLLERLFRNGIKLGQLFQGFPMRTHGAMNGVIANSGCRRLATGGGFLSYFRTTILFTCSTAGKNGCQQYGNCD
jgi:hypothetical protein